MSVKVTVPLLVNVVGCNFTGCSLSSVKCGVDGVMLARKTRLHMEFTVVDGVRYARKTALNLESAVWEFVNQIS